MGTNTYAVASLGLVPGSFTKPNNEHGLIAILVP